MPGIDQYLVALHGLIGGSWFVVLSVVVGGLLGLVVIPKTTDWMVNSAAGLTGRYLGAKWRTLVINASTNNPEAASMAVSFSLLRFGGWANPLGSLLANIYLLYGASTIWVSLKFLVTGQTEKLRELYRLLWREKKLLGLHFGLSFLMFLFGYAALRLMIDEESAGPSLRPVIWAVGGLLVLGIVVFLSLEYVLKKRRPELFEHMDDTDHNESWFWFIAGTIGVIASCWVMNEFFLAWTEVFGDGLAAVFGPLVFTWLHWVVGSLITSLPELTVASSNLEKLKAPELNTAMGAVSYSNFVNLVIALIGLLVWAGLASGGVAFTW